MSIFNDKQLILVQIHIAQKYSDTTIIAIHFDLDLIGLTGALRKIRICILWTKDATLLSLSQSIFLCLFVLGLGFRSEPRGCTLFPLPDYLESYLQQFPKSHCAIDKIRRLCGDGLLRKRAPFRVVVPGGCPQTITSLHLDIFLE